MRRRVADGILHPKQAKIDLARQVISDFHSRDDADRAAVEWQRVVASGEVPSDIETVRMTERAVRIDKMLAKAGLADSVSDAVRKIKAGAVEVNGSRVGDLIQLEFPATYVVRVGKKWRQITA